MIYHLINYNDNLQLSTTLFTKHKTKKTIEGDTPEFPLVHIYHN